MVERLTWDERKRESNRLKHGLDFADADDVLASRFRLDVPVIRHGERRVQSLSFVVEAMAVLVVVHVPRDGMTRVISYRRAGTVEREMYRVWLENEQHEP
jgi:uncharacterized DUF497 family protein